MIGFARSARASVSLRRLAALLGKSIDCPLVFASPNHDNLGFLRPPCFAVAGLEWEKGDGERVPSAFHFLSARNFVRGIGARREESIQAIFGTVLLGIVGQHQQAGFVVLVLPCLKKAICRPQRGDIDSDLRRDLYESEACGSRWRAKAWSSGQPARTRPRRKCKPELGRQETFPTAGEWMSGVAGAMPALWFQNSLINYAGERDPLQDTIKVLSISLSSRAPSSAALARQEEGERFLFFTRLISVRWLSQWLSH